jgi:hypothetical protein
MRRAALIFTICFLSSPGSFANGTDSSRPYAVGLSGRIHIATSVSGRLELATPRPLAPAPQLRKRRWQRNQILAANVGGNPSFVFYSINRFNQTGGCQATLVSRVGDACLLATAAHCLDKVTTRGQSIGKVEIETADFGNVIATFKIPAEYATLRHTDNMAEGDFDIATMEFRGPACTGATGVQTIPIRQEPLYANTQIRWGSRWEKGLYCGVIQATPANVRENGRWIARNFNYLRDRMRMAIQDRRLGGKGIKMGDSGGAIFTAGANGVLEFAGALARCVTARGENATGDYSTNDGLAWLRAVEANFRDQYSPYVSTLASTY